MTLRQSIVSWLGAWQYVLILGALLALSLWGNWHQHDKLVAAKADCRTQMEKAALIAIQNERDRAAKAEQQATKIAEKAKKDTRDAVKGAQENTNARDDAIHAVPVAGACRMPVGMPRLDQAVSAANAAAGD